MTGSPEEAVSQAMIGYGSKFHIFQEDDSPHDWVSLGEVSNITPPSAQTDDVEVTHMQSPGGKKEFIPGLIDPGECSFTMNYVPGSVGDQILLGILAQPPRLRKRRCRIIYPNGVSHTFKANLRTYEPNVPTDDKMTASVAFKVTGDLIVGTDSPDA